ncbi:hypothetical protein [Vallitalea guaymasensis]|uniref:Uncharacterized protein n=1 Tax=Vallitalea guaymasensis TaxID=1185412 RepID=A0A8J8M8E2_9FIRM|nr:hypothetical protein [Vallitalea guaymasensis]QUH28242.1 hypothetical protein HYG85_04645 [Vallitalea guaymasensis]
MEEYNEPKEKCKSCIHCLCEGNGDQEYDGSWSNIYYEYYCSYGYYKKYEKGGIDCKRYEKLSV